MVLGTAIRLRLLAGGSRHRFSDIFFLFIGFLSEETGGPYTKFLTLPLEDRELQNKALQIFIEEVFRFYGADPPAGCQAGAISFTQHFGGALNLHVHFHVVAIDGLYVRPPVETELSFIPARTPSPSDVRDVAYRVEDRFIA